MAFENRFSVDKKLSFQGPAKHSQIRRPTTIFAGKDLLEQLPP